VAERNERGHHDEPAVEGRAVERELLQQVLCVSIDCDHTSCIGRRRRMESPRGGRAGYSAAAVTSGVTRTAAQRCTRQAQCRPLHAVSDGGWSCQTLAPDRGLVSVDVELLMRGRSRAGAERVLAVAGGAASTH